MFRSTKLFAIICVTFCLAAWARPSSPFFQETWNRHFHLRAIESGDTLAVGAVFCNGVKVFVFDEAAGAIVVLDSTGCVVSVSKLEASNRGGYFGDDFVERDGQFIFLNTVDKRLEYYDRGSGKRLGAAPLPLRALDRQRKRSHRIVNRIFVAGGKIVVGNEHLVFDYDEGMRGAVLEAGIRQAPGGGRFALVAANKTYVIRNGFIADAKTGKKAAIPPTHYAIIGKRFFSLKNRLYAVSAERTGITIVELK